MKQQILVTVFGEAQNNASIHIPGRKNPAIAIQKDTFFSIIEDLRAAKTSLESHDPAEAEEELAGVLSRLEEAYELLSRETGKYFPGVKPEKSGKESE